MPSCSLSDQCRLTVAQSPWRTYETSGDCVVALPLMTLAAVPAYAEVKTREKTHVKFEGMLGKVFNLFGGKAAKEGVVATHRGQGQPQGDDERVDRADHRSRRKKKSTTST